MVNPTENKYYGPSTKELRKNAKQMFYELGYNELGKQITRDFLNRIKHAGDINDPERTEKEISKIMSKARYMVYNAPKEGFAYWYDKMGEMVAAKN